MSRAAENGDVDDEEDPPDGWLRWLISADETGVHGSRYYGFGTLWMAWQRRGDFARLIKELRDEHGYTSEIKWTKVTPASLPFYEDLVERFFETDWLSFHCCIVEKAVVRKEFHQGDYDLARRKHFGMLLTSKVRACLKVHPDRRQVFRIHVDPIHSRYAKADEAAEVICNHVLAKTVGIRPVDKVLTRHSHLNHGIQLCDLLLGACHAAWEQDARAGHKLDLREWIAYHLGWEDLRHDTYPEERKFNVWVYYDPTRGRRKSETAPVALVHPLPERPGARKPWRPSGPPAKRT
ncbi:MAG: DUF3800 domain-containing protein [Vicinamibacterales bacterium]